MRENDFIAQVPRGLGALGVGSDLWACGWKLLQVEHWIAVTHTQEMVANTILRECIKVFNFVARNFPSPPPFSTMGVDNPSQRVRKVENFPGVIFLGSETRHKHKRSRAMFTNLSANFDSTRKFHPFVTSANLLRSSGHFQPRRLSSSCKTLPS